MTEKEKILKQTMKHLLEDMKMYVEEKAEDKKLYNKLKKAAQKEAKKDVAKKRHGKSRQRGKSS